MTGGIGERIRQIREDRGIGQSELARRLGERRQTVSRWELGERQISVSDLPRIAAVLGVGYDDLLPELPGRPRASAEPGHTADLVSRHLDMTWEDLPVAERECIREVVTSIERFRDRLLQEEGIGERLQAPAF